MSTELMVEGTTIRTAMSTGLAARLFGLPFALIGAYLAYQLAGGLGDLITGRAAVTEMLAGTLLLAVMTAAFLIPGWLLLFSRAAVEIDRGRRTVSSTRDFRIYRWRDVRPLSEFVCVEVDHLTVSANRQSKGKPTYQVELAASNRKNVVVGLFDDGDAALTFGRELAGMIELPVADRRHTEPESAE